MQHAEMKEVLDLVKNEQFDEALTRIFSAMNSEQSLEIMFLLDGVNEITKKGSKLTMEQLSIISSYFESYTEAIQELSIEIYQRVLLKHHALYLNQKTQCLNLLKSYDNVIREKFIDFYIEMASNFRDFDEEALNTLFEATQDKIWNIRIKVVEFFKKLLLKKPQVLSPYRKKFLGLLAEKDLDVIAEILDFIYYLIVHTFTPNDIAELFSQFPKYDWIIQERLLWIFGKLGRFNRDIFDKFIRSLLELLDYDDPLVQKRVEEVLNEIMLSHTDIFDEEFFHMVKKDTIENLGGIENVLTNSVIESGIDRFLDIYSKYIENNKHIIQVFSDIIRNLNKKHVELAENVVNELLLRIIKDFTVEQGEILKKILRNIPHYNLYLIIHDILGDTYFNNPDFDSIKLDIINLMETMIPELGYQQLATYISTNIQKKNLSLEELQNRFNLTAERLNNMLKEMISRGMLDVIILNGEIKQTGSVSSQGSDYDLEVLKRWVIEKDPQTQKFQIVFQTRIRNLYDKPLENLSIILVNPEDTLKSIQSLEEMRKTQPRLPTNQSLTFEWVFNKRMDKIMEPCVSFLKMVIFYEKEEKVTSWAKKLDILCV